MALMRRSFGGQSDRLLEYKIDSKAGEVPHDIQVFLKNAPQLIEGTVKRYRLWIWVYLFSLFLPLILVL